MSQDLVYQAAHWGNEEVRFFVINYHKGIDIDQALCYRGTWYTITRVDTEDDYNGDMFIYVRNAKGREIPDPSQIGSYTSSAWDD